MEIYRALLIFMGSAAILTGFMLPRRELSRLPWLKIKWSERNEARWLELRACCGGCTVTAGAALLYSGAAKSLLPLLILPICAAALFIKYKKTCNKIS